jgi:hypothetical protein
MITHKVIDLAFTEEEGQEDFAGTHLQCIGYLNEQNSSGEQYTLRIVPLIKEELKLYNKEK